MSLPFKVTLEILQASFWQIFLVDDECNFQIATLFAVDIDLDTKRSKKARLDNELINAKEAVTSLWYTTIAAQHVKLRK